VVVIVVRRYADFAVVAKAGLLSSSITTMMADGDALEEGGAHAWAALFGAPTRTSWLTPARIWSTRLPFKFCHVAP
jgi:hypothetical protein